MQPSPARYPAVASFAREVLAELRTGALELRGIARTHGRALGLTALAAAVAGSGLAYAVAEIERGTRASPQTWVTTELHGSDDALRLQALAIESHSLSLKRGETVRASDSVQSLLARMGLADPAASAFLASDATVRSTGWLKPGRWVQAVSGEDQRLQQLVVRWPHANDTGFQRLVVERQGNGLTARVEDAAFVAKERIASGVIRSSLFAATDEARIPDAVASQIAEIFGSDIDFHRELRKGDRFSVVYEALEADGEVLKAGRVLSAEFVNGGKNYSAVWFQPPGAAKGAYYTEHGVSLKRAYLASPLEFSRVTSGFAMRLHPILQKWRAHLGVDYAAPTGTAIRSVGDGVVDFAGWQNGYGNTVVIKHRDNHTTLYAHMSKIAVKRGQSIEQGQTIGAVGSTGWSTGPHLHFEFRVNGVHQDPMTLAKQNDTTPLTSSAMAAFLAQASASRTNWNAAATVRVASAQ